MLSYDPVDWHDSMKNYELSKEFSYENDNAIIKLRIVRRSNDSTTRMALSGVSQAPMTYEFKLVSKVRDDTRMDEVIESCIPVMQLLLQTMYPLSKSQQSHLGCENEG